MASDNYNNCLSLCHFHPSEFVLLQEDSRQGEATAAWQLASIKGVNDDE